MSSDDPWGLNAVEARDAPSKKKRKKPSRAMVLRYLTRGMCRQKYQGKCRMKCYKKGIPTRKADSKGDGLWKRMITEELAAQGGTKDLQSALKSASVRYRAQRKAEKKAAEEGRSVSRSPSPVRRQSRRTRGLMP